MIKRFDITEEVGCSADGRIMENGERRLRMRLPNGSVYIYTDQSVGAWQNAHHHKGLVEIYIIQDGWIVVAECTRDDMHVVKSYGAGDIFTSVLEVDHNVFVPKGTVFHTVQYGKPIGNPDLSGRDWYPASEKFNEWTKIVARRY